MIHPQLKLDRKLSINRIYIIDSGMTLATIL